MLFGGFPKMRVFNINHQSMDFPILTMDFPNHPMDFPI
jgi:hypothetical protein